ncbi:MAG: hypothetical protein ACI8VC_001711 [Candidatus Endobugula sp.]
MIDATLPHPHVSIKGISKSLLSPRFLRRLMAPTFGGSVLESSCIPYTLRFCCQATPRSTWCLFELMKKPLFAELPLRTLTTSEPRIGNDERNHVPLDRSFKKILTPFDIFLCSQSSTAIVMLLASLLALFLANSQYSNLYESINPLSF